MPTSFFPTFCWSFRSFVSSRGQARGYGHRGNLNWALRCESCLMSALGRRYGERPILKEMAVPSNTHFVQCSTTCILCFLLFIFQPALWLYKHFGSEDCKFVCKKVPVPLCATLYHTVLAPLRLLSCLYSSLSSTSCKPASREQAQLEVDGWIHEANSGTKGSREDCFRPHILSTFCLPSYQSPHPVDLPSIASFQVDFQAYSAYEGLAASDRAVDSQGSDLSMA